jgi:hypothetical protein
LILPASRCLRLAGASAAAFASFVALMVFTRNGPPRRYVVLLHRLSQLQALRRAGHVARALGREPRLDGQASQHAGRAGRRSRTIAPAHSPSGANTAEEPIHPEVALLKALRRGVTLCARRRFTEARRACTSIWQRSLLLYCRILFSWKAFLAPPLTATFPATTGARHRRSPARSTSVKFRVLGISGRQVSLAWCVQKEPYATGLVTHWPELTT